MHRDTQNLLRLLFLAIAILILKTASGINHSSGRSFSPNTDGGTQIKVTTDTVELAHKAVY